MGKRRKMLRDGQEWLDAQLGQAATKLDFGGQSILINGKKVMQWDIAAQKLKKVAGWERFPELQNIIFDPPVL